MRQGRPSGMVAVVFTDLVGSTDLMSRLGEAAFDNLRRAHFAALAQAVERTGGEEIKNTGDGVMATFGSAVDAVDCAVAMQQATDRQARTAGASLAIRVGLSVGEVTFEDDDVFGTPVVEAARLVGAARPGQILATATVRMVAGSRSQASTTHLGVMELKGLPEPVPVFEVAWEPIATALPVPSLLTSVGRIFVGRDDELNRLGQLWKETVAGERRVAFLAGEPGIGKTRLAAELAQAAHGEGSVVLAGRCDEDLGVAYQPFVEALRHYAAHAGEPHLGPYGGELTRLVPELTEQVPGLAEPLRSDPETERYRLFDAVATWLADVSAGTPVLLVLDDLHWAAKPTLLLLRHVVRFADLLRLLVVGTYRDSEVGRGHPLSELLADLRRIEGVERFSMVGLDQAGVTAFIEAAAGHALAEADAALPRAVWAETEGNPFFVAEVLRHLRESGTVEQRDGRWVTTAAIEELGIPEGVREVVGRRLSRLSETTNRVLAMAAVVGLEFEPAVVAAASAEEADEVLAALEEAVAARLAVDVPGPVPRNRFAHALVRATLYDELTAARRVMLHRRVAEAIETVHTGALDDHLPALAYHWARASAPAAETARAVDYATRAGDRALAQLAHDEAVTYYREALDLLDAGGVAGDDGRRQELLIGLGEGQRRAGDPAHRETLLQAARLAEVRGEADALARAVLANVRGYLPTVAGRVDTEKVAMLEAAIAAVGEQDPRARARLLATLALELTFAGDWRRWLALSDEALAVARALGDPETMARVLLARIYPAQIPNLLEERSANTAELLTVIAAVGDPAMAAGAHALRARTALEGGDASEADRCFEIADRLSAELGQPVLRWQVQLLRTGHAIAAARFEKAGRLAVETRELGHITGQLEADVICAVQLFCLRLAQGSIDDEVVELLEATKRGEIWPPVCDSMLALAACEAGRDGEARAALDGLVLGSVSFDLLWLVALTNWAAVTAHLGDTARAEELHVALSPYARQAVPFTPWATPSVARHLGLLATTLGRYDQADTRFADAAAIHDRIGAPHWLARTRLEWAHMLVARRQPGDEERARQLLGQALTAARELRLANVERRAVALLQ